MDQQIAAFEELRKEVRNFHDCLDGMREEQQELARLMGNNFLGIAPETHVRHHNDLTDDNESSKDKRRVRYDVIGIVIATLLINICAVGYLNTSFGKQLASEHV